ncbi:MAG: caspase family protein [Spirochaetaceae bacterium]
MKYIYLLLHISISFILIAEDKFVLVIGNGNYNKNPLINTINDAYDVSDSFNELGYNVTTVIDGNKQDMEVAISTLSLNLTDGSMVILYYAGHAAQIENSNYLIPVNEIINSENDLKYKSVNLDWILGELKSSQSRTNIVILDSCRDNPYKDSTRGGSRGLNVVSTPSSNSAEIRNTAIIYATSDGNTADDGDGRNSPFTESFLKFMKSENETILDVMTNVTQDVFRNSGGKQEPTMINVFKEKVYFYNAEYSPTITTPDSLLGSITFISNTEGKIYLDGDYIAYLQKDEELYFSDLEPGRYTIKFISEEYSEEIFVDIIDESLIPIILTIPAKNLSKNEFAVIDRKIESLTNEKELLEIRRINLKKDIVNEEDKLEKHLNSIDTRDSRKEFARKSGWVSFFSYLGAAVFGYYVYDNYQDYLSTDSGDSSDLAGKLLIATGGATISGIISGSLSKNNSDKVKKYDLQRKIINANIVKQKKDLIQIDRDFEDVLTQIVHLQRTRDQI